MKSYSIRIFPNKKQTSELLQLSKVRLSVYNYYLQKNIDYYKSDKKIYTAFDTHKMFTQDKKNNLDWQILNTKCAQTTLTKLYDNYRSFFTLIKKDKSARIPKIIENMDTFRTLIFNQSGWSIKKDNVIVINKIPVKYKSIHNIKEFNVKEFRVKFKNNKWLCDLIVDDVIVQPKQKTIENKVLAIDLGLKTLATGIDSNGEVVIIPNRAKTISKYFHKKINNVKSKQSKCVKYSKRYLKLQKVKTNLYDKKNSQVKQRLHIESKKLISMNYNTIVVGDLSVKRLMELEKNKYSKVSRSFGNSNIAMFINFLAYKGLNSGTNVLKIDETNTTQLNCLTGKLFDEKVILSQRTVKLNDSIEINRDLNSAINIYNRWYNKHLAALTPPLPLGSVLMKNNLFVK